MKKLLAILTSILLLCAMIPLGAIPVSAATSGTTGDCTWTLDGTHLTISGNGKMGGYTYTGGPWGKSVTSVTIEDGVTAIGENAFRGCASLKSVTIPDSVTIIGGYAFADCPKLAAVTIPGSVTTIEEAAFDSCTSLASVTIPDSVITIGDWAFSSCHSLTSVTIPDSVTTIGKHVFRYCRSLASVTIPDSVTTIGKRAFASCGSLTDVYYDGSKANRANITIDSDNDPLLNATWHYAICDHTYDNACDTTCNECGAVRQVPNHLYDNACDTDCNVCGFVREVGDHVYTDIYAPDCNECGAIREVVIIYGDANGDGKVNNQDLGRLQQYLNGWDVEIPLLSMDVDCNGRINNKDLGLLQRYLNGWDVTLGPDEPSNPGGSDNPDDPPIVPSEPSAALPEVGYDLDGRGRIFVKEISQQGNVVTVTLENISSKWMTEETSYVEYTCTDAEGNVLTMEGKYYGVLYFGMLEAKEVDTYTFNIPTGTTKVEFGICRVVYWTQWS